VPLNRDEHKQKKDHVSPETQRSVWCEWQYNTADGAVQAPTRSIRKPPHRKTMKMNEHGICILSKYMRW